MTLPARVTLHFEKAPDVLSQPMKQVFHGTLGPLEPGGDLANTQALDIIKNIEPFCALWELPYHVSENDRQVRVYGWRIQAQPLDKPAVPRVVVGVVGEHVSADRVHPGG